MTPDIFSETFGPSCVSAMLRNGGFASVRMAQIALESAWGASTPKDVDTGRRSYNLTGVKGVGPAGSVMSWTKEYVDGQFVDVLAQFRAYESYAQHIADRDRIFDWSNYDGYRAARTPDEACLALRSAPYPYATDPNYATTLIEIIDSYGFRRYDDYVFVDVPGDHRFAAELRQLKTLGFVKGEADGRLGMSEEAIRILVITLRMYKAK